MKNPLLLWLFFSMMGSVFGAEPMAAWDLVKAYEAGDNRYLAEMLERSEEVLPLLNREIDLVQVHNLLNDLAAQTYAARDRAEKTLISVGPGIKELVRQYQQQKQADPEVRMRCKRILSDFVAQEAADKEEKNRTFRQKAQVLLYLIQLPDFSLQKVEHLQPLFATALKERDPYGVILGSLKPEQIRNYLRICRTLPDIPELPPKWVDSQGIKVKSQILAENLDPTLTKNIAKTLESDLGVVALLAVVIQPQVAKEMTSEGWQLVARTLAYSDQSTRSFLEVLKSSESLPADFLKTAPILLTARQSRHILLGGWMQVQAGLLHQETGKQIEEWINQDVKGRSWPRLRDATPQMNLEFLSVYCWRIGTYEDDNIDSFMLSVSQMPFGDVETLLDTQVDNHMLQGIVATRIPELRESACQNLYNSLENHFTIQTFDKVTRILIRLHQSLCEQGRFDKRWIALLQKSGTNNFSLLRHANQINVDTLLYKQQVELYVEQFTKKKQEELNKELENVLLRSGLPKQQAEVLEKTLAQLKSGALPSHDGWKVFEKSLNLSPQEIPELLQLQAGLLFEYYILEPKRIMGTLPNTQLNSSRYPNGTQDYFREMQPYFEKNMGDVAFRRQVLPLLCVLVLDEPTRKEHAKVLREYLSRSLDAYDKADEFSLAALQPAHLLGLRSERAEKAYVTLLSELDTPLWRGAYYLFQLDGSYRELLPALLEVTAQSGSPNYPLLAAVMIDPEHPEVRKQVEEVLFRGEDHVAACLLMRVLSIRSEAPRLSEFPEGRLDWLMKYASEEELKTSVEFFQGVHPEDYPALLEKFLPQLPKVAQSWNGSLGVPFFFQHPENQRLAVEAYIELLQQDDKKSYGYAVRELSNFSVFNHEQLEILGKTLDRLADDQNSINLVPRILYALGRTGSDAVFLQSQVSQLAHSGKKFIHRPAKVCLANIAKEEAVRRESLDSLFDSYKIETFWKSQVVYQISNVHGQDERVIPFLIGILEDAVAGDVTEEHDVVQNAIWGLARYEEGTRFLSLYRKLLDRAIDGTLDQEAQESLLWTLRTTYPDQLASCASKIEAFPKSQQGNISYWKTLWLLRKSGTLPTP